MLQREPPDTAALGQETRDLVRLDAGVLVLDDTTPDQPYAKKMELVTRHWSGKHGRVVWGINLLTLLWSDGRALIPCDFRLYDKPWSGLTKNDSFRQLLAAAKERGFAPRYVLFDRGYSSLKNLKAAREMGWPWRRQLRPNRPAALPGPPKQPIWALPLPPKGGNRVSAELRLGAGTSDGLQRRGRGTLGYQ